MALAGLQDTGKLNPEEYNMNDIFQLQQKAILVSGASRGIGRGIALNLAKVGVQVGVGHSGSSENSKSNAEELCHQIEAAGSKAIPLAINVNCEDDCQNAVKTLVTEFGGLYGVVNNAGISIDQLAMRYKVEDWDKVLNTNLRGAFLLSKAALRPLMKNKDGSSIVNMSSVVGLTGNAGQSAYCASKAGLIGLSKSLAKEFASRKIRVNCIAPGFIDTDMTKALDDKQQAAISENIPLSFIGSVDDIAWGTLYLLSPLSRYVTGHTLSINGGLHMA